MKLFHDTNEGFEYKLLIEEEGRYNGSNSKNFHYYKDFSSKFNSSQLEFSIDDTPLTEDDIT